MSELPRRRFVTLAAASAASIGMASRLFASQQSPSTKGAGAPAAGKAAKPLRILVLGGTQFLGPEVVQAALARGHTVTLFNRGRTRAELFPELEKLRGDRDPKKGDGLKALEGREWDVCIDDCGYYPRMVKASAELLAPKIKQYIFVSSISAFKEGAPPESDESAPVATLEDPTVENMGAQFQNYGGLKALCEQAAEAAMPGRVANVRPGFIVGPGDVTGRFSYWPLRAREGGEMLGPGSASDPVQWIDVRDLAEFLVHLAEQNTNGVFIATGPKKPGTIGEIIDASIATAKATAPAGKTVDTTVTWVPTEFLMANQVSPGGDLPIWIPPEGEYAGFHRWNVGKAVAAGLSFRPLDATIRGIYTWYDALTPEQQKKYRAGLSRDRETEVLKAWHEAQAKKAEGTGAKESKG